MNDAFEKDCLEILSARAARGEITRRHFAQLTTLLAVGAPLALRATSAVAQAKQLVFVNWGGDAVTAYDKVIGQSFTSETGIPVKVDGSGPTEGAVIAQFRSGAPSWDVVDLDPYSAITLGKQGIMEPIDYQIVDRSKMRPGFGWDHAASTYFFSYVIAYDSERYGGRAPTGMADFFDVEKFPGKRALYKWGSGMWEAALIADGVGPERLYPLDLKRANDKIAAFEDNIVAYWGGGSESQSLLMNGEASMALVWSTRASLMEQDSGGRIKFIWDQGLLSPGGMAVIKGNPAGRDTAMQFIASAQDARKQVEMFDLLGQGPGNPAADALLPEDKRRLNPVDPANAAKQVALDMEWYSENYATALDEYTRMISA